MERDATQRFLKEGEARHDDDKKVAKDRAKPVRFFRDLFPQVDFPHYHLGHFSNLDVYFVVFESFWLPHFSLHPPILVHPSLCRQNPSSHTQNDKIETPCGIALSVLDNTHCVEITAPSRLLLGVL